MRDDLPGSVMEKGEIEQYPCKFPCYPDYDFAAVVREAAPEDGLGSAKQQKEQVFPLGSNSPAGRVCA